MSGLPSLQQTAQAASPPSAARPAQAGKTAGGFSFADLLDVVNPLQHLPVIGTLYRAITGDGIGTLERIAGDGLYGGLMGAVSAVADTMFEAVTGKDFGSTVLALFTGDDETPNAVASAAPAAAPAATPAAPGPDVAALTGALSAHGVDGDTAARALYAYRKMAQLPLLAAR
jgi:hypothetical protein